jgi:hypothetical protein
MFYFVGSPTFSPGVKDVLSNIMVSPWKGGTPRRLCNALGLLLKTPNQLKLDDPNKKSQRTLINWGCSVPYSSYGKVLNTPPAVASASNKLTCFRILTDAHIPTLEFTVSKEVAKKWLPSASVIAHTDLHGHSGSGLQHIEKGATELPDAKVYTRYFAKKSECRVHVIRGVTFVEHMYLEKKRISPDRYAEFGLTESPTTYIRTYENGWIFARDVIEDNEAIKLAYRTVETLRLDYAAVDIMKKGMTYVVGEVNTAPGLEGQALDFYVRNLRKLI